MNKSYSKIRHIQESNRRLEERLLNEASGQPESTVSEESIKGILKNTFTDVNEDDLMEKWEKFKIAFNKCTNNEILMDRMVFSVANSLVGCIMTIFGMVYSLGLLSVVGGAQCTGGLLLGGKTINDTVTCIKDHLAKMKV